jgi:hypothetical protein
MIAWRSGDGVLEAAAAGATVFRYRFGPEVWKPYVESLRLPAGPELLADAPPDHPHHHGLWYGHGRVEAGGRFHDVWLERPGCGRIAHAGLELGSAGFVALGNWQAADGAVLARDRRSFQLEVAPDRLVVHLEYELCGDGVRLHGTNESGLPLVRPAPWLAARGGGRVRDSEGRTGEGEIFGRAAAWIDCVGPAGGLRLVDDPANLGRPTRWFVRDYGPLGPNDGLFDPAPRALPLRLRYTLEARP